MIFHVAHLLKGTTGMKQNFHVNAPFLPEDKSTGGHVNGVVSLTRTDIGIWVHGTLNSSIATSCSRCLEESLARVSIEINDVYYPKIDVTTGSAIPMPTDTNISCVIDSQHMLDITDVAWEHTMVGMPMKPLCNPSCFGLCSYCGINLNYENCSCKDNQVDPKWVSLLKYISSTEKAHKS
jgi:uncharacterized protein